VAYAVSAFYERTDHMSPVAMLLAAVLHAVTAAALFWVSPLNRHDLEEDPIEVTIEQPKPPPEPAPVQEAVKPPPTPPAPPPAPAPTPPAAEAAPPPPPAAAAKAEPKPAQTAASKDPLGVAPPAPVAPEPKQKDEPAPQPPKEATVEPPKPSEPPKPPEPPEAKPQPPQEAAAAPAEPPLEKVVPPVEAPRAPLTMRDFVKVLPPPSVPQPPPPRPQQPLQHSPLSPAPASPQNSASAAVPSLVNPAEEATHTRAKNAYLLQVLRKFGQFLPNLRDKNEGGTVVLRFVIARDGRLVEASILKSSGVMALDKGMLDTLRAAAPYPPLPPDIPESQVVFVQPITARQ